MNRTTRIAPLLLGTLALSAPLLAHPPGMHHGMQDDMFASMDANHDGRISAGEHAAAAQAMFTRADANHDGYVSPEEMQGMHPHRADHDAMPQAAGSKPAMAGMDQDDQMPGSGGMHRDMDMREHFKAMDSDGDGRISAREHAAGAAKMFASLDADHDGFLSRGEFDAGHAAMMHDRMGHGGMDHAGMFKAMDADGDGRISAREHAAGAARMFATMDADHDGFLSRSEFDAGHAAMMHGDMDHDMDHHDMDHAGMGHDDRPADPDDRAGHP